MQKNWYIVYTKPRDEKKVASLLTKRKIENFCPLNCKSIKSFRRSKMVREPLFKSYVFANMTLAEIPVLEQVSGIISILHWRDKPAVIKQAEIDAIKEFTNDRRNIEIERVPVNVNDIARVFDDTYYFMETNVLIIKNKALRVILPSLGYVMIAAIEDGSFLEREVPYKAIRQGIYKEDGDNKDN